MKKENLTSELVIKCGSASDDFEKLKALCEEEAKKLSATIKIPANQSMISVPFWTSDFPELIGVAQFRRNENGSVAYVLDFSESTL